MPHLPERCPPPSLGSLCPCLTTLYMSFQPRSLKAFTFPCLPQLHLLPASPVLPLHVPMQSFALAFPAGHSMSREKSIMHLKEQQLEPPAQPLGQQLPFGCSHGAAGGARAARCFPWCRAGRAAWQGAPAGTHCSVLAAHEKPHPQDVFVRVLLGRAKGGPRMERKGAELRSAVSSLFPTSFLLFSQKG